jgi:hypothetical protein
MLKTKKGEVRGAFYRPQTGEIDLIGLARIIERRLADFKDDMAKMVG